VVVVDPQSGKFATSPPDGEDRGILLKAKLERTTSSTALSSAPDRLARRASHKTKPAGWRVSRKRLKGLEPSTFCMASRRSSQLSYSRKKGGV
jgi:hypothetical protein